jgi:AcrR family transcriptional regulator
MADEVEPDKRVSASTAEPRRYDSPLRRQRANETRDRILAAGSALARSFPTWDWEGLNVSAVADRAGINKTTVYRHFPTERELRGAIMRRIEDEVGITYDHLELEDISSLMARAFAHLSSFAAHPESSADPASPTAIADQRRRDALLRAVTPATTGWSSAERRMAAAMLDVLWSTTSHARLTEGWNFDHDQTVQAVTWGIGLFVEAIRDGHRPHTEPT